MINKCHTRYCSVCYRINCQQVFCKSIKFQATLLKKRLWHIYFPVDFAKSLRKPFFTEQLDDDIAGRHLSLGLFLGIFSGFIDFSLVFVHVKSKRYLHAFLSITLKCLCYFQIYDFLRVSIPSNFYLSLCSCDCDVMIIVMQLSQDQFQ